MSEKEPDFDLPVCPLLGEGRLYLCEQQRCAWWIKDYKSCAVKDIAMTLDQIRQDIQEIVKIKAGV